MLLSYFECPARRNVLNTHAEGQTHKTEIKRTSQQPHRSLTRTQRERKTRFSFVFAVVFFSCNKIYGFVFYFSVLVLVLMVFFLFERKL